MDVIRQSRQFAHCAGDNHKPTQRQLHSGCGIGFEHPLSLVFPSGAGSPTPCYTGDFGGKAKGNLIGGGFGFCAGCDAIACEIPELAAINLDNGGTTANGSPFVQLLNNDGSRNTSAGGPDVAGIVSYSHADT